MEHVFDHEYSIPGNWVKNKRSNILWEDTSVPKDNSGFAEGFAVNNNPSDASNQFANMFVGWVTGQWAKNKGSDVGKQLSDWMISSMSIWLN